MAEILNLGGEWVGRLVRVLLVFRALVLLITVLLLPVHQRTLVVAGAVILAALISYVPLRHWTAVAASVARHPVYLALEVLLSTLILAAAGARSAFFYFTLGTAALAGVIYGRRGAIPFSALLMAAYELVAIEGLPTMHHLHDVQSTVLAPLLYPAAVAAGIAARALVERGVQSEALLREHSEALAAERERVRVARELHDSLAKTVEGLAMSASILPSRCERDPSGATVLALQLAQDARQAASEARALMSDLRLDPNELSLVEAVRRRALAIGQRSGIAVRVVTPPDDPSETWDPLAAQARHELLRILGEALLNARRHGGAANATVSLEVDRGALLVHIVDDGSGLHEPVDLEQLKATGHFGVAGMHERARSLGGDLNVSPARDGGTVVALRVPLPDRGADPGSEAADGTSGSEPERSRRAALPLPGRDRGPGSARVRA